MENDDCLEWDGFLNVQGYGYVYWAKKRGGDGNNYRVHRLAWILAHGPIPAGMVVCHSCDNPSCYRVSHLFLGSQKDNIEDKMKKGRHRGPRGAASR